MKNSQLALAGVLGLAAGFGAVYYLGQHSAAADPSGAAGAAGLGGHEVAQAVSPAAGQPASAPASDPMAAQPAGELKPSLNPANARKDTRYLGGVDKLDTGENDLSKVAVPTEPGAHDHGQEVKPGWEQLLPDNQADLNKGRIAMVEGEPQVFDFGKIRQGDLGKHDFLMVSAGDEPLVVTGVKPSCGCTKADIVLVGSEGEFSPYVKGDTIPVGQRFALQAEITTDGRQGPFNAQVSLYANDNRGVFSLSLKASIEPMLAVKPSPTVFFGKMTTAEQASQTISIVSTQGEAFRLSLAQETLPGSLQLEYTAKDPDAEGRSAEWEVKVTLGPDQNPGMQNYGLNFKTDMVVAHPKYPSADGSPQYHGVLVNVTGQVVGMVSVEPAFITFGMVRPGEPVERVVRLEAHDDFKITPELPYVIEGLQGQEFPFTQVFKVDVEPAEDGRVADLKLRLEGFPDDLSGSFGGVLKLKIGHPSMPELLVRFSGVCRAGLPAPTPAPPTTGGGN